MEKLFLEYLVSCQHCGKVYTLRLDYNDYLDWAEGDKLIQDAMPYLTAEERELLISGTCGECWKNMFSCMFDDEEEE